MSVTAPPLMMTIDERQKCFEERKRLESQTCSANSHYVNLGVDIDNGVLLTPENSPSNHSTASYKETLCCSTESLTQPPPPTVSRCSVLTMPSSMLPGSPVAAEQDQQGGYSIQQQGVVRPVHSPMHMGSPYSSCSSGSPAEIQQVYSPENFDSSHLRTHSQPLGSPPYPTTSSFQSNLHRSPEHYAGARSDSITSPTFSAGVEGMPPQLIPFSNAMATTCGGPITTVFSTEPAIYSVPPPQMVEASFSPHPSQLPPFPHVFEGQLPPPPHEGHIHERHSSPESFCSDTGPISIKQMPNEFGIEFYHPPTPTNIIEGQMIYHPPPELCGGLPPEMCGAAALPPLPNHICPIPTLSSHSRRRAKQHKKVPVIEVDDSDIKDIPTSAQLWEFTLRVLKKPKYKYMVSWEKREEGLFRFNNAQAFAALWGKHRNRPQMSYDKVARALRYYYKRNILEQVGGRLTYRFTKRLSKLYMSDV